MSNQWTELKNLLQQSLSTKRFNHSVGVCDSAIRLAERYTADIDKAALAGLLHDCARELPREQLMDLASQAGVDVDDSRFATPSLLHAPAGSVLARIRFGINDPDILQAIRLHTVGACGMSALDKIVFLADYIEPGRSFPGVDQLREIAFKNLDAAVLAGYDQTLLHLVHQQAWIHPLTIDGRNDVLATIKQNAIQ